MPDQGGPRQSEPSASERRRYVPEGEPPPTQCVIEGVAALSNRDPSSMQPLYTAVDPDALDTIFAPPTDAHQNAHVTFEYEGCQVTVQGDGQVLISKADSDS